MANLSARSTSDRRRSRAGQKQAAPASAGGDPNSTPIFEEAQRDGLLLGMLDLALLTQPDPVAAVMKRTRGRLGRDHTLDT